MRNELRREAGQTVQEMAEQLTLAGNTPVSPMNRMKSKTVVTTSEKTERLRDAIEQQQRALTGKRIDLKDCEAVKQAAIDYLQACSDSGVAPLFMSFASSLGLSRQCVYRYMQMNPDSETTAFLEQFQTSIAAIMASRALDRQCSEVMSIFLLKNSGQGLQDRQEFTLIPPAPYQRDNPEDVARRYAQNIEGLTDGMEEE